LLLISVRTGLMSRRSHHAGHEGHEEWNAVSAECGDWLCNVTGGGVVNRTGYYTPQVLFVSFVVKQFCISVTVVAFDSFSLVTHLK